MDGIVIDDLLVDLIRQHQKIVFLCQISDHLQSIAGIDPARGVARVDQGNRTGLWRDMWIYHARLMAKPSVAFTGAMVTFAPASSALPMCCG